MRLFGGLLPYSKFMLCSTNEYHINFTTLSLIEFIYVCYITDYVSVSVGCVNITCQILCFEFVTLPKWTINYQSMQLYSQTELFIFNIQWLF